MTLVGGWLVYWNCFRLPLQIQYGWMRDWFEWLCMAWTTFFEGLLGEMRMV